MSVLTRRRGAAPYSLTTHTHFGGAAGCAYPTHTHFGGAYSYSYSRCGEVGIYKPAGHRERTGFGFVTKLDEFRQNSLSAMPCYFLSAIPPQPACLMRGLAPKAAKGCQRLLDYARARASTCSTSVLSSSRRQSVECTTFCTQRSVGSATRTAMVVLVVANDELRTFDEFVEFVAIESRFDERRLPGPGSLVDSSNSRSAACVHIVYYSVSGGGAPVIPWPAAALPRRRPRALGDPRPVERLGSAEWVVRCTVTHPRAPVSRVDLVQRVLDVLSTRVGRSGSACCAGCPPPCACR